jgi:hypothetical protein
MSNVKNVKEVGKTWALTEVETLNAKYETVVSYSDEATWVRLHFNNGTQYVISKKEFEKILEDKEFKFKLGD